MNLRKPIEHFLSARRGSQANSTAIRAIGRTFEQTFLRAPIHQFDNRVVLQAKGLRCISNRRRTSCGDAGYREQKLVLLRMEARLVGGILADQQEIPQLMSKRCKGFVERLIWVGRGGSFTHPYILSYYDIFLRTSRE